LLIAADVLHRQHYLAGARFLVNHETGFGELVQYGKAAAACAMLASLAVRRWSISTLAWAGLLLFVLVDDSMSIHERAGNRLAAGFGLQGWGSLRANHVGELIFFGCAALVCAAVLASAWYFGREEDRRLSRALIVWFGALGFCAVVLDAVSSLARGSNLAELAAIVEDGGEMVVMSMFVATLAAHCRRTSPPVPPRTDRL
jgi:hypothetical protein